MAAARRFGLSLKFSLLIGVLVVATVLAICAIFIVTEKRTILERTKAESLVLAQTAAGALANALVTKEYGFINEHCMMLVQTRRDLRYIVVVMQDGKKLIHKADTWWIELPGEGVERSAPVRSPEFTNRYSGIAKEQVLEATAPILVSNARMGAIRLGFSEEPLERHIAAMYRNGLLIGLVCLILALAGTLLLTRVIARPILLLTEAAKRISGGDLTQEVPAAFKDEIGELATSFNKMVLDLQQAMVAERAKSHQLTQAYDQLSATLGELQSTQAKLIQAGKLAALGELGAGIAHELNQPITSIRAFAQLMLGEVKESAPERVDTLERIVKETGRMARIVDNVRTFARQQPFTPEPVPATKPMDDALALVLEQLKRHEIVLEQVAADSLPRIAADSTQLQQVFLNLLSNARDAVDDLDDGRAKKIRLAVERRGDRVQYTVEDSGIGVPAGHEDDIFDPFFTTKAPGRGMGLGLSLSYGIVNEHGGEIAYERVPSGGSRFMVSIPIADGAGAEAAK